MRTLECWHAGLDLLSYLSMGLLGINLPFSRLILGLLNKIQERYTVATPPIVLVKKNFNMNCKYLYENGFLRYYGGLALKFEYLVTLGMVSCLAQNGNFSSIFLHTYFSQNLRWAQSH